MCFHVFVARIYTNNVVACTKPPEVKLRHTQSWSASQSAVTSVSLRVDSGIWGHGPCLRVRLRYLTWRYVGRSLGRSVRQRIGQPVCQSIGIKVTANIIIIYYYCYYCYYYYYVVVILLVVLVLLVLLLLLVVFVLLLILLLLFLLFIFVCYYW